VSGGVRRCREAAWDAMGCQGERAVLLPDQAPTREKAAVVRVFGEHNATVVLFPPDLARVMQPVDMSRGRRSKGFLSRKFQQLARDGRLMANACAELKERERGAGCREASHASVGCVLSSGCASSGLKWPRMAQSQGRLQVLRPACLPAWPVVRGP
jgi:hypothetical protein